jgi:hypothetical protein
MRTRKQVKIVHESPYIGEVEVELILSDDDWAPYLSLEDAGKLDRMRQALRRGELQEALRIGRVYRLTPITSA